MTCFRFQHFTPPLPVGPPRQSERSAPQPPHPSPDPPPLPAPPVATPRSPASAPPRGHSWDRRRRRASSALSPRRSFASADGQPPPHTVCFADPRRQRLPSALLDLPPRPSPRPLVAQLGAEPSHPRPSCAADGHPPPRAADGQPLTVHSASPPRAAADRPPPHSVYLAAPADGRPPSRSATTSGSASALGSVAVATTPCLAGPLVLAATLPLGARDEATVVVHLRFHKDQGCEFESALILWDRSPLVQNKRPTRTADCTAQP